MRQTSSFPARGKSKPEAACSCKADPVRLRADVGTGSEKSDGLAGFLRNDSVCSNNCGTWEDPRAEAQLGAVAVTWCLDLQSILIQVTCSLFTIYLSPALFESVDRRKQKVQGVLKFSARSIY